LSWCPHRLLLPAPFFLSLKNLISHSCILWLWNSFLDYWMHLLSFLAGFIAQRDPLLYTASNYYFFFFPFLNHSSQPATIRLHRTHKKYIYIYIYKDKIKLFFFFFCCCCWDAHTQFRFIVMIIIIIFDELQHLWRSDKDK
jgi:hypothetical protein